MLVYTIGYKNTAAESATVTITDRIPEFTDYVENSADNGGVYNDGVITWELEVEAGATVTVSFKVKAEWVESAVITNKATILEGKNTYTTNEVSNPTENTVPNIPDTPDTPDAPYSPKTGDTTNLHLWFALLFVSGGGIFGTAIYGRKRKEEAN